MESHGKFPKVLNVLPREKIEGPPRDFLKANSRPHTRPDQRPKTRGAACPAFNQILYTMIVYEADVLQFDQQYKLIIKCPRFLAFGLAEHVAKGSPE